MPDTSAHVCGIGIDYAGQRDLEEDVAKQLSALSAISAHPSHDTGRDIYLHTRASSSRVSAVLQAPPLPDLVGRVLARRHLQRQRHLQACLSSLQNHRYLKLRCLHGDKPPGLSLLCADSINRCLTANDCAEQRPQEKARGSEKLRTCPLGTSTNYTDIRVQACPDFHFLRNTSKKAGVPQENGVARCIALIFRTEPSLLTPSFPVNSTFSLRNTRDMQLAHVVSLRSMCMISL